MNIFQSFSPLFQTRRGTAFILSSFLGRLPNGFESLAVLLYFQSQNLSVAFAGTTIATFAIGSAAFGPIQGRILDHRHQTVVFIPLAFIHASSLCGLIVIYNHHVLSLIFALVAGASIPRIPARARTLWPSILSDQQTLLRTALSLESIMSELSFVLGPLLLAAIAMLLGPAFGLAAAAFLTFVGTFAFLICTQQQSSAEKKHQQRSPSKKFLGPLTAPAVRLVCYTMLTTGTAFGAIEVLPIAAARAIGKPALGGIIIAILSLASVTGGLIYGSLKQTPNNSFFFPILASSLPVSTMLFAVSGKHTPLLLLLAVPAGFPIAPLMTVASELLESLTPTGMLTEAFTWMSTSLFAGFAFGSTLSGNLATLFGWQLALISVSLCVLIGTSPTWFLRKYLSNSPKELPSHPDPLIT